MQEKFDLTIRSETEIQRWTAKRRRRLRVENTNGQPAQNSEEDSTESVSLWLLQGLEENYTKYTKNRKHVRETRSY